MNLTGRDLFTSVGWKESACVQNQKSSFYYLLDAPVQRWIASIDYHFTSHICDFCVMSLGLQSCSRSAHQATHQSFLAGTTGAMKNHAQVGASSRTFGIDESAVRLGGRWSGRNLRWCHSTKMADHENSHSADRSIKFSGRHTSQTQASEVRWAARFSGHWVVTSMFA